MTRQHRTVSMSYSDFQECAIAMIHACRRPYCAILCFFVRKPKVSGGFSNNPRSRQVYTHPPTHPHQTQNLPHRMCNVLCEGISGGKQWSNMIQFLKPCVQLDSSCIPMSIHSYLSLHPTARMNIVKQSLVNQVHGTVATSLAIWLPRPPWSSTPHRRDPRVHRKWPDLATGRINCCKS